MMTGIAGLHPLANDEEGMIVLPQLEGDAVLTRGFGWLVLVLMVIGAFVVGRDTRIAKGAHGMIAPYL